MPMPKFNGQISLGSILQLIAMAVAAVYFVTRTEALVEANRVEILRTQSDVEKIIEDARRAQQERRATDTQIARADERFTLVLAAIARIEARLERDARQ